MFDQDRSGVLRVHCSKKRKESYVKFPKEVKNQRLDIQQ